MQRSACVLLIQTLIVVLVQCQLPENHGINTQIAQAIGELQRSYQVNNVSVVFVNVIRELQPENVIKSSANRDFKRVVNETECAAQFSIFLDGLTTFEQWALESMKN